MAGAQRKKAQPNITAEDIELLQVYVDSEQRRAPIVEFADARRKALVHVLANLVARWMLEKGFTVKHIATLNVSELLADAEVANAWHMYLSAVDEADIDDESDDNRRERAILRLALKWKFSPLNAVRAARGDAELRMAEVAADADYKYACRLSAVVPKSRRPGGARWRLGSFAAVTAREQNEPLAVIRVELIKLLDA